MGWQQMPPWASRPMGGMPPMPPPWAAAGMQWPYPHTVPWAGNLLPVAVPLGASHPLATSPTMTVPDAKVVGVLVAGEAPNGL